jgi:cytoskeletal protein CcmA (bactofilin family)
MFKRKTAEQPSGEPTVVGRGSRIAGTLRVTGRVQIDGEVEGHVIAEGHVSIGPTGSVIGELTAGELVVGGRIEGTARIKGSLHIVKGGSAVGVLQYTSIQVDRGGALEELSPEQLEEMPRDSMPISRKSARVEH